MKKKQILKKLIKVYENAIDVIECVEPSGEVEEVKSWLDKRKLDIGICNYAMMILRESIVFNVWVIRNSKGVGFWCHPPYYLYSIPKILTSLRTRLKIMQKEILIKD